MVLGTDGGKTFVLQALCRSKDDSNRGTTFSCDLLWALGSLDTSMWFYSQYRRPVCLPCCTVKSVWLDSEDLPSYFDYRKRPLTFKCLDGNAIHNNHLLFIIHINITKINNHKKTSSYISCSFDFFLLVFFFLLCYFFWLFGLVRFVVFSDNALRVYN